MFPCRPPRAPPPAPFAPGGALGRLYPTGVRNYTRVYPADDVEAAADVLLARQLGLRRVFVLDDGTEPGREIAAHFRRSAGPQGVPVVGAARWDPTGRGFAALADRIARARADGVLVSGLSGSAGGPLVKALRRRLDDRVALIAPNPFGPVDFVYGSSGGAAKGMYLSVPGPQSARLGPAGRAFLRDFSATQPGALVSGFAVYAAAATEALLSAIARSDGTRASVTRALLATRLRDSTIGPISFTRDGDLTAPAITIMRVRRRDGVSTVPGYEGAAIDRVIAPPAGAIR
jgi:branched-chain amino acid transport system substrate-binding protein